MKYFSSLVKNIKWDVLKFTNKLSPKVDNVPWVVNRNVNLLYRPFIEDILSLVYELHHKGCNLYIFEGYRSFERQSYLYEQGRTRLYDYLGRKLPKVTNAKPGFSYHNYGMAVDLVFDANIYKPGMQWTWDGNYSILGETLRKYPSLEWAGDWNKFKEFPHVQLVTDYDIYELKEFNESNVEDVWNVLDEENGFS